MKFPSTAFFFSLSKGSRFGKSNSLQSLLSLSRLFFCESVFVILYKKKKKKNNKKKQK